MEDGIDREGAKVAKEEGFTTKITGITEKEQI